ncbi:hypothetical protein Q4E93_26600 [Flavitalea sp. BT771]|uniref:hypothetical protein n=1 Tax=Flavitalea sp. BT771 TaxID=3063329 RepID=UPI0026E1C78E|nr:hypothetical protein [Flavitalea sp. BT771]MDO6434208.1 hypothetical protein [Flavitalea sp. BT771]MDV6223108.1 hypothetical protein [Flavitalea sp. BT771]
MKLAAITLLISCAVCSSDTLFGQSTSGTDFDHPGYNSLLHISTDNGNFKGRLVAMTDSSLTLLRIREKDRIEIPAGSIGTIKVKRRFFRSVLLDACVAATLTGALVVGYYWNQGFWTPEDPPFGQSLLYGLAFGTGAGGLFGIAESAFFKLRLPVNKSLDLFRKHRDRLMHYWAY